MSTVISTSPPGAVPVGAGAVATVAVSTTMRPTTTVRSAGKGTTKSKAKRTTTTLGARMLTPTTAVPTSTTALGASGVEGGPTTTVGRSKTDRGVPGDPAFAATLAAIRKCESGNRYDLNTGNGYYGAYQFALGTWRRLGYPGYPHEAAPEVQDAAATALWRTSGWRPWGLCARKLGLV